MILSDVAAQAAPHGLFVMGSLHDDGRSIVLLGANADMWPVFKQSPEFHDGQSDALDRWSKRIIGQLAKDHDAQTVYPSDGPPYAPFIAWAKETGRFWQSPTGMLIHDTAGLMISIRGALRFSTQLDLDPQTQTSPCDTCADRPCETACPVDALTAHSQYDVPRCKAHLTSKAGADCMSGGCLARRACPISKSFGRDPEQSAFHMRAFV